MHTTYWQRRKLILATPLAVVALAATFAILAAQDDRIASVRRAAGTIVGADIYRDANIIASDANMGRATPSPGFDSAAAYIARELGRLGLRPMGDNGTFFQRYTVTRSLLDTLQVSGSVGNEPLRWGDDFIINSFLVAGVREANVVYVGHGVRVPRLNVDPYAGLDIRDKWVLVHSVPPAQLGLAPAGGTGLGRLGVDYTTVREEAKLRGALGILLVPNSGLLNAWNRRATSGRDLNPSVGWAYAQNPVPRVLLSREATTRLLSGTSIAAAQVLAADSSRNFPASGELGAARRVRISFAATATDDRPYNVVALLEGSDPQLRDQWISVAAHLDGAVGGGVRAGDSIYNAADDNASGSAGTLAITRALVAGPRPKRSVLLIWDSGEEVGLWGTRHLAYGPLAERIVAHINNDMIGRAKAPGSSDPREQELLGMREVYVTGPRTLSTNMEALLQRTLAQFPYVTANRSYDDVANQFFYPRTDAGPYMERGISVVQFFTGLHGDYHLQGDNPDKLNPEQMEAVSRQSYAITWMLADTPEKPLWDKPVPYSLWWVQPRR